MYNENKKGLRNGAQLYTIHSRAHDLTLFIPIFCCLKHRKAFIHFNVAVVTKSNIKVST